MKRLRRIDPRIFDWVLAIGLAVGGSIEIASRTNLDGPLALNVLADVVVAVAVLVRRRRPLARRSRSGSARRVCSWPRS